MCISFIKFAIFRINVRQKKGVDLTLGVRMGCGVWRYPVGRGLVKKNGWSEGGEARHRSVCIFLHAWSCGGVHLLWWYGCFLELQFFQSRYFWSWWNVRLLLIMVLYSGVSDTFQYNSADGMTDLTNASLAKYVSVRSAITSPRDGTHQIHQTSEPVISSSRMFHEDHQIHHRLR